MADTPQERLRDAIEEYVRAVGAGPVLTDYVLCAASVDYATAGESISYTYAAPGARHVSLGLIDVLTETIVEA